MNWSQKVRVVILTSLLLAAGISQASMFYVANTGDSSIKAFDSNVGNLVVDLIPAGTGGLSGPTSMVFGPDQNLYVASLATNSVLKFNGQTGALISTFVATNSGGLDGPTSLTFGNDGNLYVLSRNTNAILKFDGTTGAFLQVFATQNMAQPQVLALGPDGNFYVANTTTNQITRYDTSGNLLGNFGTTGVGGLNRPTGMVFSVDGNLWIASNGSNEVIKLSGATGALLQVVAGNGLGHPVGLAIDDSGVLFVSNSDNGGSVLKFNATTGSFIDSFISTGSPNLNQVGALLPTSYNVVYPPVAVGPADFSVNEGTSVNLTANGSFDPNGLPLTYQWSQISGTRIPIISATQINARFVSPLVNREGADFIFSLKVNNSVFTKELRFNVHVNNVNQAPFANAGGSQSAFSGDLVFLNGLSSFDPDQDPLTYSWTQVTGPAVTLDLTNPGRPSFLAPTFVDPNNSTFGFRLVVSDGTLFSNSALVNIIVNQTNQQPVAVVGPAQTVDERTLVQLNGQASYDPEGAALTYRWSQTWGPLVTLNSNTIANPTFIAPDVSSGGDFVELMLTVSDGVLNSGQQPVRIQINNVNRIPLANAGVNFISVAQSLVTLDGTASSDPDGDALTYSWTQLSGPVVALNDATLASPSFTAPSVPKTGAALVFQLRVSDGQSLSDFSNVTVNLTYLNQAPVANAGIDQIVDSGSIAYLDGTNSFDPDGDNFTYAWTQVSGPMVTLSSSSSATPSIIAPAALATGTTLTFQLVTNDGLLNSNVALVNISVKILNQAPVANAGITQSAQDSVLVTLDASGSFDPDGDILSYVWTQTAGPSVILSNTDATQTTFTSPIVGVTGATLTFQVTVSDAFLSSSSLVNVIVQRTNHAPIADAGKARSVRARSMLALDGSLSRDPDADAMTYVWTQVLGPVVTLDTTDPVHPSFLTPNVSVTTELKFQLVVDDKALFSSPSLVSIMVTPDGKAPNCGKATVEVEDIWPPRHKLAEVEINGIFREDEDDGKNAITFTSITQDEPTSGIESGDIAIDAMIRKNQASIRTERRSTGNGRAYVLNFTAKNRSGLTCSGSVKACIPMTAKGTCVDDGQKYNSLQ